MLIFERSTTADDSPGLAAYLREQSNGDDNSKEVLEHLLAPGYPQDIP